MVDITQMCIRDRWKHHGAQKYAEEIERYAREHTDWLREYFGNSVSSEWMFPKIMQVAKEDPEIYRATDLFMEAVDWIVSVSYTHLGKSLDPGRVNEGWRDMPEK